jgi:ankyrin repeat protein
MGFEELFTSIEKGDLGAIDRVLSAEPAAIKAQNAEGLTPIVVAAYWGRAEILERLLGAAGPLDFWEAATVGATDRVEDLVDHEPDLVGARSPDGFTALHLAVFFGHPDTARFLIDAGADVLARTDNALNNQPIHAAVAGSDPGARLASVELLLTAGAAVNERQSGGFTPLMAAAQNGDDLLVDRLLLAGADPSLVDDEGNSAAAHATKAGHLRIAARLQVPAN